MKKIKVGFIMQDIEWWDKLDPVFREVLSRDNMEAIGIVVPRVTGEDILRNDEIKRVTYGSEHEYFHDRYKNVIDYVRPDKTLLNIEGLGLDYIFYQTPYEMTLTKELYPRQTIKYCKPCYIPYAYIGSLYFENYMLQYKAFFHYIYLFFPDSTHIKDKILSDKKYKILEENGIAHCNCLGYPALETAIQNAIVSQENTKKYILWTPRWSYDEQGGGSHFLEYKEAMFALKQDNPREMVMIRPHPQMFGWLEYNNLFPSEQRREYIRRAEECGIIFDKNGSVMDTLKETKLLITDFSSIIINFFLANIPMIYCSHPNVTLNDAFKEIIDTEYVAHNEDDIKRLVQEILERGDYKRDRRAKIIERYRKEHMGATKRIVDRLCEDYDESKRRSYGRLGRASAVGKLWTMQTEIQEVSKGLGQGGGINHIIEIAHWHLQRLEEDVQVAPKAINAGWMRRYLGYACNVEDDKLQEVWAKLFVEELLMPGSISPRTLSVLYDISTEELEKFQKNSKFIVQKEFFFSDNAANAAYGVSYEDILDLDACGLLHSSDTLSIRMPIGDVLSMLFRTETHVMIVRKKPGTNDNILSIGKYPLTQAGKELCRVIGSPMDMGYLLTVSKRIKEDNPNAEITLRAITDDFGGGIFFGKESLI